MGNTAVAPHDHNNNEPPHGHHKDHAHIPDTRIWRSRGCFQQYLTLNRKPVIHSVSEHMNLCLESWCALVNSQKLHLELNLTNTLVAIFCAECCDRLMANAPHIHKRLISPADQKAALTATEVVYKRYAQLCKVLTFILKLKDDSINSKHELRAIGRAHLRRAIHEEESKVLIDVILDTVTAQLGPYVQPYVIEAWHVVLSFVLEQMYFDKIVFKSHCTRSAPAEVALPIPVQPISSGSSPLSGRLLRSVSSIFQRFSSQKRFRESANSSGYSANLFSSNVSGDINNSPSMKSFIMSSVINMSPLRSRTNSSKKSFYSSAYTPRGLNANSGTYTPRGLNSSSAAEGLAASIDSLYVPVIMEYDIYDGSESIATLKQPTVASASVRSAASISVGTLFQQQSSVARMDEDVDGIRQFDEEKFD
jgi:hemoglobin-like flavoprotein